MSRGKWCVFLMAVAGAQHAGAEELVDPVAPVAAAPTTLWNFLGIPQGFNKLNDNRVNRFGNRPNAERKPPLKTIADPANLKSPSLPIQTAANIKQQEDLAPQKIKALKYLARMGCGCYDKDGAVTDSLMASVQVDKECTEAVRFEAALAIKDAASNHCSGCGQNCCCKEKIALTLSKVAYEMDEKTCCFKEPSERVRMAAKDALFSCCRGGGFSPPPVAPVLVNPEDVQPKPVDPDGESKPKSKPKEDSSTSISAGSQEYLMLYPPAGPPVPQMMPAPAPQQQQQIPAAPAAQGAVESFNEETRTVDVRFSGEHGLRPGHRMTVWHKYLLDESVIGQIEVVSVGKTSITGRAIGDFNLAKLRSGDLASSGSPVRRTPAAAPVQKTEQIAKQSPAPAAPSVSETPSAGWKIAGSKPIKLNSPAAAPQELKIAPAAVAQQVPPAAAAQRAPAAAPQRAPVAVAQRVAATVPQQVPANVGKRAGHANVASVPSPKASAPKAETPATVTKTKSPAPAPSARKNPHLPPADEMTWISDGK